MVSELRDSKFRVRFSQLSAPTSGETIRQMRKLIHGANMVRNYSITTPSLVGLKLRPPPIPAGEAKKFDVLFILGPSRS